MKEKGLELFPQEYPPTGVAPHQERGSGMGEDQRTHRLEKVTSEREDGSTPSTTGYIVYLNLGEVRGYK